MTEPFLLEEDPFELNDPCYVPPSAAALAALDAGIESARSDHIVFRDESFTQYADDALPVEPAPIISILPTVPVTIVTVRARREGRAAEVSVWRRGVARIWEEGLWT